MKKKGEILSPIVVTLIQNNITQEDYSQVTSDMRSV